MRSKSRARLAFRRSGNDHPAAQIRDGKPTIDAASSARRYSIARHSRQNMSPVERHRRVRHLLPPVDGLVVVNHCQLATGEKQREVMIRAVAANILIGSLDLLSV